MLARMPDADRLARQLEFILEVDRLKSVLRRSLLVDGSRNENSAEHSWHIALMAVVLAEHADEVVDVARVVRMLLVHDVVEIDAGDTYVYDVEATSGKAEREGRAAERLFGLLPEDQAAEVRALWDEFERRATPEARFAHAIDRLQPLLHNFATQGRAWRHHGVTADRVESVNRHMAEGSERLWEHARRLIAEAVERGYLGAAIEAGAGADLSGRP